jgi:hypothetical protein
MFWVVVVGKINSLCSLLSCECSLAGWAVAVLLRSSNCWTVKVEPLPHHQGWAVAASLMLSHCLAIKAVPLPHHQDQAVAAPSRSSCCHTVKVEPLLRCWDWAIALPSRPSCCLAIKVKPLPHRWDQAVMNDNDYNKMGCTITFISINNLVGGIVASGDDLDVGFLCSSLPILLQSLMTLA